MIITILSYIAAAIGTAAQWADGFTTWQGVKKFGPSIEGDTSWFAQFCVHHPSTLLYLKALIFGAAESAMIYVGPHTNEGGNVIAIVAGVISAALGFYDAYGNYKINKGPANVASKTS